jgi:hypothetical protein
LNGHLKRKYPCVIKNSHKQELEETELRVLFEQLRQEHEQLKNENKKLMNYANATTSTSYSNNRTNTNLQNNSNNNNNNVTINVYGNEDMSHITEEQYKYCFKQMPHSVEYLFDLKHFSEKMPQNHNMFISNIKDTYMMVFRKQAWMLADRETTLKKIYYDIKDNLSTALDKMRNAGTIERNLERFFSPFVEDDLDEEKEAEMKRISFKQMSLLAYNCRHAPMKHYVQMEKELLKNK